jgi:hypothetical protein
MHRALKQEAAIPQGSSIRVKKKFNKFMEKSTECANAKRSG